MAVARYVKDGAGQRDGQRWIDARALSALNDDLLHAKAGDSFLVGFDRDRENPIFWSQSGLTVRKSGAATRPIRISCGYIGHNDDVQAIGAHAPAVCFLNTSLSPFKKAAPDLSGEPYLRIIGASNIDVGGCVVRGAPNNGFIRIEQPDQSAPPLSAISLHGIHASHVGRVIETERGARLDGISIEDCSVFGAARGFARFRSITNSTLTDLVLDAGGIDGGAENVCQLIAFESGTKIRCENVLMRDAVNMIDASQGRRSGYVQGDGIVCERETSEFMFRNCHASGMGDGGFDLKTRGFLIEDCSTTRCKYGVRVWSQGGNIIRRMSISSPRGAGTSQGACLWVGGQVDLIDCDLHAGASAAVFRFAEGGEGPPRVRMFGGRIRTEGQAPLVVGLLGGSAELNNVTVNGAVQTNVIRP
jgi:hypothetical protein